MAMTGSCTSSVERLAHPASVPSWVRHEHAARYEFASAFARGKTVVDVGCGAGLGAEAMQRMGAARVVALDLAADAVTAAHAANGSRGVQFLTGRAEAMPVLDGAADLVLALETIEHLQDEAAFLREASRVLTPGGMLICSTPNRTITNPGASLADRPWNPFHVREWSVEEFGQLLSGAFRDVAQYGQNPCRPWAARAFSRAAAVLPRHGAVRIRQFLKLPWLMYPRPDRHAVQPMRPGSDYEYLVAVCRDPLMKR